MTALASHRALPPVARPPRALGTMLAIARRELRDALSSRWFLLYTIAFSVLAVAVSFLSLAGSGSSGFAGFGRTTAGLLNLIMLIVPLLALTAGAGSIAGERERGTLMYLIAQPVTRVEIVLGKFAGLAVAICASLLLGFGLSAAALTWRAGGVGVGAFMVLVGMTCLLGLAMLAIGMLVSALSRRTGIATGLALFVWLALVFLSDLGLMAGSILFKLRVQEVFALAIVNPLQAFKMAVVIQMNASLDVLGPAGMYASLTFGDALRWMLPSVVAIWCACSVALATILFSRRTSP